MPSAGGYWHRRRLKYRDIYEPKQYTKEELQDQLNSSKIINRNLQDQLDSTRKKNKNLQDEIDELKKKINRKRNCLLM